MKDADKYAKLKDEYMRQMLNLGQHYGRKNKDEALSFLPNIPSYR
jgi:hypothetical protein